VLWAVSFDTLTCIIYTYIYSSRFLSNFDFVYIAFVPFCLFREEIDHERDNTLFTAGRLVGHFGILLGLWDY